MAQTYAQSNTRFVLSFLSPWDGTPAPLCIFALIADVTIIIEHCQVARPQKNALGNIIFLFVLSTRLS